MAFQFETSGYTISGRTADAIITHINKIFFDLTVSRTNLFYLYQDYEEIKALFWNSLTQKQRDGIVGKVQAYEVRMKTLETTGLDPMDKNIYNQNPITESPGNQIGPLPGLSQPTDFKKIALYAAAGVGAALLLKEVS